MNIERLDHLVLTVANIDTTVEFYQRVLGFEVVTFSGDRKALNFGQQKINLHQRGAEFEPKALHPTPGSADLCFVTTTPMADVLAELEQHKIAIEQGPVETTGALGPILSVYLRDPDDNLIEVSEYLS